MTMRSIVVGLGVQGHKRRFHAGRDFVAAVDPVNPEAEFRDIRDVPLDLFDAALCCLPDAAKMDVLEYLLGHGKHVLVEKPLYAGSDADLQRIEGIARSSGAFCYTAYNHRFEPHIMRMKALLLSGVLGQVYHCRLYYGNGTARQVRDSEWRDRGAGVLSDLGCHLLDIARFWFSDIKGGLAIVSCDRFENQAPDHVVFASASSSPRLEFEVTLLSWRNHFACDLIAENGSAHIESLCKWGPSHFVHRRRVLPSGRPPEEAVTLVQDDPTWAEEYAAFKQRCARGEATDLSNDIWLNGALRGLATQALGQIPN